MFKFLFLILVVMSSIAFAQSQKQQSFKFDEFKEYRKAIGNRNSTEKLKYKKAIEILYWYYRLYSNRKR